MMRKITLLYLFVSFLIPLHAEEESELLDYYDAETVTINYSLMGGITLNYQGNNYGTLFGLDAGMKSTLSSYAEVKKLIDSYSSMNTAGNIMFWGGLVALTGGTIMAVVDFTPEEGLSGLGFAGFGIGIGGLVFSTIGQFLIPASFDPLIKGVNVYNRNKIEEYR
jgi:hypothetical protein